MSNFVEELSAQLSALVEAQGDSVVRIEGAHAHPTSGVAWSEGVILAAAHAVADLESVELGLPDGASAGAEVAGIDPATDLAVLKADPVLTPAAWKEPASLKVGELALALARPGRALRARLGIVSVLGDEWRSPAGGRVDRYVETDHDLPRGHSGALWVSAGGAALGLLTAGLLRSRSVALPVPTLRRVVEGLLAEGRIARGYLGVNAYPVSLPLDLARDQGQDRGLILLSVQPESPAARAGLIQGDVLLELRGHSLRHVHDLLEALGEDTVGRELEGRLIRAGSVRPVRVLVGERGTA